MRSGLIAAVLGAALAALPVRAFAEDIVVSEPAALTRAIQSANPGDRIILAPGDYRMGSATVDIRRPGRADRPIVMRAATAGRARIHSATVELFKVFAPYWTFEGLDFVGNDGTHHAFHVVAGADRTTFRGNRFRDFHAAIKGNAEGGRRPDHVVVERNVIFNTGKRRTEEPVTPIDVVQATGWVVRENFIADFAKDGGDETSYAAFFKGGSTDGVFERNLVICEWHHTGGYRVGLSFGGGGSPREYWTQNGEEHARGVMRNNIIANCPNAEGIYINRSGGAKIYNNTIYNAYGIMARFAAAPSDVRNNIVSGAVATHDGARLVTGENLETGLALGNSLPGAVRTLKRRLEGHPRLAWLDGPIDVLADWLAESSFGRGVGDFDHWFAAPGRGDFAAKDVDRIMQKGERRPEVEDDFCGQKRLGATDLGAIEYTAGKCDSAAWSARLLATFN